MADAKKAETVEVVSKGGNEKPKISEMAAVTVHTPAPVAVAVVTGKIDLGLFTVAKVVTRPVLRLVDNDPVVFRVDGAIYEGKALEGSKMAAAHLMDVTNAMNGAASQIVVPKVLQAELEAAYPNASYLGKWFGVEKLPIPLGADGKPTKKYSNYRIVELDASNFALPA